MPATLESLAEAISRVRLDKSVFEKVKIISQSPPPPLLPKKIQKKKIFF